MSAKKQGNRTRSRDEGDVRTAPTSQYVEILPVNLKDQSLTNDGSVSFQIHTLALRCQQSMISFSKFCQLLPNITLVNDGLNPNILTSFKAFVCTILFPTEFFTRLCQIEVVNSSAIRDLNVRMSFGTKPDVYYQNRRLEICLTKLELRTFILLLDEEIFQRNGLDAAKVFEGVRQFRTSVCEDKAVAVPYYVKDWPSRQIFAFLLHWFLQGPQQSLTPPQDVTREYHRLLDFDITNEIDLSAHLEWEDFLTIYQQVYRRGEFQKWKTDMFDHLSELLHF